MSDLIEGHGCRAVALIVIHRTNLTENVMTAQS